MIPVRLVFGSMGSDNAGPMILGKLINPVLRPVLAKENITWQQE